MIIEILQTIPFYNFLIKAKQNTYAADGPLIRSSRPGSIDLAYTEEPFRYLDSYFGGFQFIGEEMVWYQEKTVWGMNYLGHILVENPPADFAHFLKSALLQVPQEMPYRGPEEFVSGDFCYTCSVDGSINWFRGKEFVFFNGQKIYQLYFHGGEVRN
ncbi:MAG: hypothetical protein BGO78_05690 [Chloroflexi bacterium 44-23]|nr:MAG: hypothetical protein BGO78_05690 [Chloroflexi bacterium 44-23]